MKDKVVRDIMTNSPITISGNETLWTVGEIFKDKKIHHVPVVEKGKLIGIISSGDFERCKRGKSLFVNHDIEEQNFNILNVTLVGMVMTKEVITIAADETLIQAYQKFKKYSFRSLPVVENEKLVGIITPMDFLDEYFN